MMVFDMSEEAVGKVVKECDAIQASSVQDIGKNCNVVFSMLPNDKAVVSSRGYLSILSVSYFMWSSALHSSDVLLSCNTIPYNVTHKHHTDIYSL